MDGISLRHYEIRRVLGRGGTGVVYEAYDRRTEGVVALKTIEALAAENLYRLKQEFRVLTDVQHQNLIRLGELSCENGHWFFTMELIQGEHFIDYVRPRETQSDSDPEQLASWQSTAVRRCEPIPNFGFSVNHAVTSGGPKLDEGRLRSTLLQLVAALEAIHEAGRVHRDVKPSNVLVTTSGRLVLLDFGLVTALGTGSDTHSDNVYVVGTPAYMAPEQMMGAVLGPAADWYAVGVMLYRALTGVLPFRSFEEKLVRNAPSPRLLVADAPDDLVELCMALLRLEPGARPNAEAIRRYLQTRPCEAPDSVPCSSDLQPPFVGRKAELDAMKRALVQVECGLSQRLILEGEPGVGKSALAHHFLHSLGSAPILLEGRCYEQESVPFKGIDSIVDALSDYLLTLPEERLAQLTSSGVSCLAALFPVLARVPSISEAMLEGRTVQSESGLRELGFTELERLLDRVALNHRLIIFLDDLQWADADSVALLKRLLLRRQGAPFLFLATLRRRMEQAPGLLELVATCERIRLCGLAESESRELWEALCPAAHTCETAAVREAAMRDTSGHPFLLAEIARAARAGERTNRTHTRLQDVLWDRIQRREAVEQRFIAMLCVAGTPLPYEIIAKAAGVDVGECLTRLGNLKAAQLIRITRRADERLVEPYHDRIREAVLEQLKASGNREILERKLSLGLVLRAATSDDALPQRIFAILQHLDAARELLSARSERIELAALHLIASRTARLATAYDRARQHARAGLNLVGDAGFSDAYQLTSDLLRQCMEADYLAGDVERARTALYTARQSLAASKERVAFYASWICLETAHGNFAGSLAAAREILSDLGMKLPDQVSKLSILRLLAENRIVRGARTSSELSQLKTLSDANLESQLRILMALAPMAFFTDSRLFGWIMLRIAGLSMKHGMCSVSSFGFSGYGMVLTAFKRYEEAAAFGKLAAALNERFRNESLAAKIHLLNGGFIMPWTEPFAAGKAELYRSHEAAMKNGDITYEAYAVANLSILLFCAGENLRTLLETSEWAQEISMRLQEFDMAKFSSTFARYAATLRGTTDDPLDLGIAGSSDTEFRDSLSGNRALQARLFYNVCRAELAYTFGENESAREFVNKANENVRGIAASKMTIELSLLEALVAAREYESAPALERPQLLLVIARSVQRFRRWSRICPENFEVHFLIARAEFFRVTGATAHAQSTYNQAIAVARSRGPQKREALALELAAKHARRSGQIARAEQLEHEAIAAYRAWGAEAKARALESKGPTS